MANGNKRLKVTGRSPAMQRTLDLVFSGFTLDVALRQLSEEGLTLSPREETEVRQRVKFEENLRAARRKVPVSRERQLPREEGLLASLRDVGKDSPGVQTLVGLSESVAERPDLLLGGGVRVAAGVPTLGTVGTGGGLLGRVKQLFGGKTATNLKKASGASTPKPIAAASAAKPLRAKLRGASLASKRGASAIRGAEKIAAQAREAASEGNFEKAVELADRAARIEVGPQHAARLRTVVSETKAAVDRARLTRQADEAVDLAAVLKDANKPVSVARKVARTGKRFAGPLATGAGFAVGLGVGSKAIESREAPEGERLEAFKRSLGLGETEQLSGEPQFQGGLDASEIQTRELLRNLAFDVGGLSASNLGQQLVGRAAEARISGIQRQSLSDKFGVDAVNAALSDLTRQVQQAQQSTPGITPAEVFTANRRRPVQLLDMLRPQTAKQGLETEAIVNHANP